MKIASILPYKENYTKKGAGAVSLWISSFLRDSIYSKTTFIYGSTKNRNCFRSSGMFKLLWEMVLFLKIQIDRKNQIKPEQEE